MLIDAIVGVGFSDINYACAMVSAGLALFTGNQHHESWSWDRERLQKLEVANLIDLYLKLREMRGDPLKVAS